MQGHAGWRTRGGAPGCAATLTCPSVTCLFLVTEGQHVYGVVRWLVAVKGDVSGVPESNHQLAQLGYFRKRPANVGGRLQQQELPRDGLSGAPGGFGGPRNQEAPAALQTLRCALGDDYLWHSGTALSSSVPQVFNQVRTS